MSHSAQETFESGLEQLYHQADTQYETFRRLYQERVLLEKALRRIVDNHMDCALRSCRAWPDVQVARGALSTIAEKEWSVSK